jgi:hypothetical protein
MFPPARTQYLKLAVVGAFLALTASTPARVENLPKNLGPVTPNDPILTDVGTKRVLAWYQPDGDGCAVNAVLWNRADIEGTSTAGIRIKLRVR